MDEFCKRMNIASGFRGVIITELGLVKNAITAFFLNEGYLKIGFIILIRVRYNYIFNILVDGSISRC